MWLSFGYCAITLKNVGHFFLNFSYFNKNMLLGGEKTTHFLRAVIVSWISIPKLLKSWENSVFARSIKFLPFSPMMNLSHCLFVQKIHEVS